MDGGIVVDLIVLSNRREALAELVLDLLEHDLPRILLLLPSCRSWATFLVSDLAAFNGFLVY